MRKYETWNDVPETSFSKTEMMVDNHGRRIWGKIWLPEDGKEKHPLIIVSHGLGANYLSLSRYAKVLAGHGFACYLFDFRGGGGSHSDGSMLEMSVLTEISDLEAILDSAGNWDFVDPEHVILMGESQGGVVSALTAVCRTEEISGLILLYPALALAETNREMFPDRNAIPERFPLFFVEVGRKYAEDIYDLDLYGEIAKYKDHVLLMHGDKDPVIPLRYAVKLSETLPDVEFHIIKDGMHGFELQREEVLGYILGYLQDTCNL
ncbi:MAG: alpha/beta fold hydrolase [Erysipelotrichaceae bacterium]|nr:alpha/beta fold hydrolase [Erysipelotrichaceae bacterium]